MILHAQYLSWYIHIVNVFHTWSKKAIGDICLQFSKVIAKDFVIACVSIGVASQLHFGQLLLVGSDYYNIGFIKNGVHSLLTQVYIHVIPSIQVFVKHKWLSFVFLLEINIPASERGKWSTLGLTAKFKQCLKKTDRILLTKYQRCNHLLVLSHRVPLAIHTYRLNKIVCNLKTPIFSIVKR